MGSLLASDVGVDVKATNLDVPRSCAEVEALERLALRSGPAESYDGLLQACEACPDDRLLWIACFWLVQSGRDIDALAILTRRVREAGWNYARSRMLMWLMESGQIKLSGALERWWEAMQSACEDAAGRLEPGRGWTFCMRGGFDGYLGGWAGHAWWLDTYLGVADPRPPPSVSVCPTIGCNLAIVAQYDDDELKSWHGVEALQDSVGDCSLVDIAWLRHFGAFGHVRSASQYLRTMPKERAGMPMAQMSIAFALEAEGRIAEARRVLRLVLENWPYAYGAACHLVRMGRSIIPNRWPSWTRAKAGIVALRLIWPHLKTLPTTTVAATAKEGGPV
jgi:hypothetical protein